MAKEKISRSRIHESTLFHRTSVVHVIVPKKFKRACDRLSAKHGSLSAWMRPHLLRWLAEECPAFKPEVDQYLDLWTKVKTAKEALNDTTSD